VLCLRNYSECHFVVGQQRRLGGTMLPSRSGGLDYVLSNVLVTLVGYVVIVWVLL
jgi:hypothetical protein